MTSVSLSTHPLSFSSYLSSNDLTQKKFQSHSSISIRRRRRRIIVASVSGKPSSPPTTPIPTAKTLPIREIPGSYGLPLIGAIKDRLDYFYGQGREAFFASRVQKHKSTVFRTNMPPGPFISSDPKVVALLDAASFPILFDVSKVEKKDLFTGTYMPSTALTGGYRILSYLDPSEPMHAKLKQLLFFILKSSRDRIIPEFQSSYSTVFSTLESQLASKGKAGFNTPSDVAAFSFLARALFQADPAQTELGDDAPNLIATWVLLQLGPILSLGLPAIIEEPLRQTFPVLPFLVKKNYDRLYRFFRDSAGAVLDEAERLGISKEEATHNLLFATCFNSFGGMKIMFPALVKRIGQAGAKLHRQLAEEIRSAVKANGGEVSMRAMEEMPLMKSVVYETLRIDPPVQFQYGRAKRDLIVESHDAAYEVRKGEMLFGFQPMATKDPRIFDKAVEFVGDRFVGEEGEKLLKYVVWSNGPETEHPTVENKQCAGKDFVVLAARLLVVELFRRYDSFEIEVAASSLGPTVTFTSLKRASF
ncbi:E1 ubiquitin-activating protein aos1 [Asimina triloba]